MGIRFLCPNGHKLNVKSGLAGKRASCPECGAKLVVPVAGAEPKAAPAAILANPPSPPSDVWYLRTASGQQLGPATEDQFSGWIADGLVTANSHAWREGWAEWRRVRDVADVLPTPLAAIPVVESETASVAIPVEESLSQPVAPAEAEVKSGIEVVAELDAATAEPIALDTGVKNPAVPTAATYAVRKRQTKKTQLTLAVAMLVAVIVLAGVLVWVISNNATAEPPVSYLNIFDSLNARAL